MRTLLVTLVLAICFSGFSTVLHAFQPSDCDITALASDDSSTQEIVKDTVKSDAHNDNTKDDNHVCTNCSHCHLSHASLPQPVATSRLPVSDIVLTFTNINPQSDFISGLKRPPKILA